MRSIIMTITIAVFYVTSALAAPPAPHTYYDWPEIVDLPDTGRIQIYDPREPVKLDRHKNITGAKLKEEVVKAVNTPSDVPLQLQPSTATNPYQRKLEVHDANGKITMFITANGTMVFGTPVALAVTDIYPPNGATGVLTTTVPKLTTNIYISPYISTLYVQGSSANPIDPDGLTVDNYGKGNIWFIPATLVANTTYTIKFLRQSIVQTYGETTSSCGPMTDNADVCESTFTTGP